MNFTILIKSKSLSFLFILLFALSSAAQNNAVVVNDSINKENPIAIPTINIIEEIEIATEKIKDIKRRTQQKTSIKKIDSIYPTYKTLLSKKRLKAQKYITSGPNKQKVNNLLHEWNRYYDYLKSWESTSNNQLEKNSLILKDVAFDKKTWELTLEDAKNQNVPAPIIKSISAVQDDFEDVKIAIKNQNNKNLVLESKINYLLFATTDVIEKIENLKNTEAYDIFYKRHNVLWDIPFKKTNSTQSNLEEKAYFGNISLTYLETFKKVFILFILLTIALHYFIKYLKKGFDKYQFSDIDSNLKTASIIYNQSKLVTVFIGLIVAKILFSNLPDLITDFIILLILLSTIPIIRPYLSGKFQHIVYVVILFFILDSAKTFIWFEAYQYRIYLLAEALLVIASIYYFTQPYRKIKTLTKTKLSHFLVKFTPVYYVLIIVSILSNIFGYTNLSDISLKIFTQGVVLSVIFFGILKVFEASANAILHRHYNAKASFNTEEKNIVDKKIIQYVRISIFIVWLVLFLQILDQLKPILDFVSDILSEPYSIGSITLTIGSIVTFLMILIGSFLITKLISFTLDEGDKTLKFLHLPKGIPRAISVILRYLILAFGVVFAVSSLGIDLTEFNLMAGALGLGIGFGLQNVISNFVSGLILIFERPILPGDTVEVNNLMGTVNKIGVRSSKVSTFDGADVVVPNNNLVSNDLINWTLSTNLKRTEILVGVSYDSDPNEVLNILLECASDYDDIVKDPAPNALFSDFGDNSLNFRLRFWTHFSISLQAKSDISITIYNKFKEHNIEIPFPQQDVYIKDFPDNKKQQE